MQEENTLYLDKEGYEEHLKSIDNLLVNCGRIEEKMSMLVENNYDKDEYQDLKKLRDGIKKRINEKRNKKIVIIEKQQDIDIIDIGDIVKIKLYYSEIDVLEEEYELVAGASDFDSDITKVSINTPIGQILYGSNVNSINNCNLNGQNVKIEILEKVNAKKLEKI